MRIIKRRIIINNEKFDIWLGLVKKIHKGRVVFHLYYYPGDPDDEFNKPQKTGESYPSEKEAIERGKEYMRELYTNALNR